jgi:hypothetical protein
MSAYDPVADVQRRCDQSHVKKPPKHRHKAVELAEKREARSYLRRLTPMALAFLPFWLVVPFLVEPERFELILSGTVATWRLLLMAAVVVLASFLSSAGIDWDERRKKRARR